MPLEMLWRSHQTISGSRAGGILSVGDDTRISFRDARLWDVTLTGRFQSYHAAGSVFDECQFENVYLATGSMSHWPPTLYRLCRFVATNMTAVRPGFARAVPVSDWNRSTSDLISRVEESRQQRD